MKKHSSLNKNETLRLKFYKMSMYVDIISHKRKHSHSGIIGGMTNTCITNYGKSKGRKKKSVNPESLRCQQPFK